MSSLIGPLSDVPMKPLKRGRTQPIRSPSNVSIPRLGCVFKWEFKTGDSTVNYSQIWRPSKKHKFPLGQSLLDGHEQVKELWARLLPLDEDYERKYLVRHAIDTNHIGGTFLLTPSVRGCSLGCNLVLKRV